MTTDFDLVFSQRWMTLGHYFHYWFHSDYRPRPDLPLPDAPTSSAIQAHISPREDFPRPDLVDAIDRRWGRSDPEIGQRDRMVGALGWLAVYDPVIARLVRRLCLEGTVTLMPGRGVRHLEVNAAAEPPFAGDTLKLQRWLQRGWELVGIVVATPEQLDKAVKAQAADRTALAWLTERGALG